MPATSLTIGNAQNAGNHTLAFSPHVSPSHATGIDLVSLSNRDAASARPLRVPPDAWVAVGDQAMGETSTLELMHVAHATLDKLSKTLATEPLPGDAFAELIRGGFAGTALAIPMADSLAANVMPLLLDPQDPNYADWQDVLVHALVLPPDRWATELLALRPRLSQDIASRTPLFNELRDALYRPECLSPDVWRAYVASMRDNGPTTDVQHIAREYQKTASMADKNEQDVEKRLRELLPTLGAKYLKKCMALVRRHQNDDRGLLDVRVALPAAFEGLAPGAIDAVYAALAAQRGRGDHELPAPVMHAPGIRESTDTPASLLLEVGRIAHLAPQPKVAALGDYSNFSRALVSLLYGPTLRDYLNTTAHVACSAEYLVTRGQTSLVQQTLAGVWEVPGWMQSDVEVHHLSRAQGDASRTVDHLVRCAGHHVRQKEEIEAFLRKQGTLQEHMPPPSEPVPTRPPRPASPSASPSASSATTPLAQIPSSTTNTPADGARLAAEAPVDTREQLPQLPRREYPATEAYLAVARLLEKRSASFELSEAQALAYTPGPGYAGDFLTPRDGAEATPATQKRPEPGIAFSLSQDKSPKAGPSFFPSLFPAADASALPRVEPIEPSGAHLLAPGRHTRPGALTETGAPSSSDDVLHHHLDLLQQRINVQSRPSDGSNNTPMSDTAGTVSLDPRGDLRILHDVLREQQKLLQTTGSFSNYISTDKTFVPLGMHSPFATYAMSLSPLLTHLTLSAVPEHDLAEPYASMNIGQAGLKELRQHSEFRQFDLNKPINVKLSFEGGLPRLQFNGTNVRNKAAYADVRGAYAQYLSGYINKIEHLLANEDTRKTGPKSPGSAAFKKLSLRDDGQVTLQSMLKFYGIDVPAKATQAHLTRAIKALRPKAALIAGAGDRELPTLASSLSIDTVALPAPISYAFNEHETSDYGVISREIKRACDEAHAHALGLTERHGNDAASLLLASLKNAGGIAITLELDDTDGVRNTYSEQHSVNPKDAANLAEYFNQCARLLGDYMIRKIRDTAGEDEGAINIARLAFKLYVPSFAAHDYAVSEEDIKVFDMRSKSPPFLYIDADSMSIESNQVVANAIGKVSAELRDTQGDVSKCPALLAAVNRFLEVKGISLSQLAHGARGIQINEALDAVLGSYYRISSENIKKQQRLLLAQQPTQQEFLSRAICRQLGIDEFNWPVIMGHRIPFRYATGLANQGRFTPGQEAASETMLGLLFKPALRRQIGLATDKTQVCAATARSIAQACLTPCDAKAIEAKIGTFFQAFTLLDVFSGVRDELLPEALFDASGAYTRSNDRYIADAVPSYRKLEAERIVLTSPTALDRLAKARGAASASADIHAPYDFESQLSESELGQLDERVSRFKDFLSVRRNTDDFHGLQSSWAQSLTQLKDMLLEICRNAPLEVCMVVNLVDDIAEDADEKTIAMDGLFYLSSALGGLKNGVARQFGALMHQAANAWSLEQSVQAYRQAVKDGSYERANQGLIGILMSVHSMLASGAAFVERVYDHVTQASIESAAATSEEIALAPEERSPAPPERRASERYWTVNGAGVLSMERAGRKVIRPLWNGDLLVEGGARAIALSNGIATVYMLGDTPHQVVRAATGLLEVWPIRDLGLPEDGWAGATGESGVRYSRPGLSPFPEDFTATGQHGDTASYGVVAWYDNHVATFETITARQLDAEGASKGPFTARIGVLEHKYVLDHAGSADVLEHGGTRDGKTLFIRNDGSVLLVDRTIPTSPRYKNEIKATLVGNQGMFAVVDIAGAVDGVAVRHRVSGVLAAKTSGGHELVLELDNGVYYRGDVDMRATSSSDPDSGSTPQPVSLSMRRISPTADPKRASPSVWRARGAYRDSEIARDDFALELLFGSKMANRSYLKNPDWVLKQRELIQSMRPALPPEVRTTENPCYKLTTDEADAILFAPRNRAALAQTLIAENVEWGAISSTEHIAMVEDSLRHIRISGTDGERSPLFGPYDSIPIDAGKRVATHALLKEKLHDRNLVLAELETKDGEKVVFAAVYANDASGITVDGNELAAHDDGADFMLDMTVMVGERQVHSVSAGSVVRRIESAYPDPTDVASITIFSLDAVPGRLAEDIFASSASGYSYRALLRLQEQPGGEPLTSSQGKQHTSLGIIRPSHPDLTGATLINDGPRKGAYLLGEDYYIRLNSDGYYRAIWDSVNRGFRLAPEGTGETQIDALPLARKVEGKFRLAHSPGAATGKATPSLADLRRMKSELESNPTPPVLRTIGVDDAQVLLVADPGKVAEKMKLDGSWVWLVDGIEYQPALTQTNTRVYIRDAPSDEMTVGCSRSGRAIQGCVARSSTYIESKDMSKGTDLPAEGTDTADLETWTPWASDVRVYGSKLPDSSSMPATLTTLHFVPYEGTYRKIETGKNRPEALTPAELGQAGLPARVAYADRANAQLLRRQGHGAQLRITAFDPHFPDSKMEVGASIFKEAESDMEWIIAQYDGTWYLGKSERRAGAPTARSFEMTRMRQRSALSPQERYIQRLHAGMQSANYHAKVKGTQALENALQKIQHLGFASGEHAGSTYFQISTTGSQAYLFDRETRENVQVRVRKDAGWDWLKLDEIPANDDVIKSRDDMLQIAKQLFPDQVIDSIDDLLRVSADREIAMGVKNFLVVRIDGRLYFGMSGKATCNTSPPLFRGVGKSMKMTAEITLRGKSETITYINADPKLDDYRKRLDASMEYPPALPTVARPDQVDLTSSEFHITAPRTGDSERQMIAYLTQGGVPGGLARTASIEVLNRNDACKSCASLLQTLFEKFDKVTHFYGNSYDRY